MKLIDQVSNILKVSRAARNSDKELLIIYFQKFGLNLSPEQVATFRRMPSVESIRRRRQLLQEQGLYPASEAVNEQRYQDFQAIRGGEMQAEAAAYSKKPVTALPGSEIYETAMELWP